MSGLGNELNKLMTKLKDTRPLPEDFPRQLLFELYVARTILFASFTIGIRLGSLQFFYAPLLAVFGPSLMALATYLILPIVGLEVIASFHRKSLNVHEMRVLLLCWALVAGVFSAVCNMHYVLSSVGAPSYFMPVLVGITIQAIGPIYDKERIKLVAVSVGSAGATAFLFLALLGEVTLASTFALAMSSLNAVFALQLVLYDIVHEKFNVEVTHAVGIIIAMFNYLLVCRLTGRYVEDASLNDVSGSTPIHGVFSQ